MIRRFLQWFIRNRETDAITIAQAPNLVLWIVIAGSVLIWVWPPPDRSAVALDIVVKGGLFVWAIDEVFRGVNPWRRCLGQPCWVMNSRRCYGISVRLRSNTPKSRMTERGKQIPTNYSTIYVPFAWRSNEDLIESGCSLAQGSAHPRGRERVPAISVSRCACTRRRLCETVP